MKKYFQFSSMLFYGITGLTVLVCIISFGMAISWIDKPFSGFLTYQFPRVGSMNRTDWPGIKAGLKIMDKIKEADGRPTREGTDLIAMASEKGLGTWIYYSIESKGQIREVNIPTMDFGLNDFIMVFFIPFAGGVILLALGFIVYMLKPNISTSWVFFLSCVIISIYMMTGFEIQSTYFFVYLHWLIIPFMPALLIHLGVIFPERKEFLKRYPALEYLNYLPPSILAILYETYLLTFLKYSVPGLPDIKNITTITRLYSLLCMVGLISLILHSMYRASSSVGKQRAKMILFGATIGWFLPGVIMTLGHLMKISFPWSLLPFLGIFFPASIAYSIVRHNLFDSDVIIKRTVGYVLVTAVIVGVYVLVSISLNVFLGGYGIAQSRAFPVVFTLIIILIFNPLRNRLQNLVDRIFFRKEYNAKQIIDRLGTAMTTLMDLPQILRQLLNTFTRDMFIDNSAILLLDSSGSSYQVRLAEGEKRYRLEGVTFHKNEPLTRIIEKEKKEITRYDVLEDPKYKDICLDCAQNFATLDASLIVPMVLRGEVIGFLSLGQKKSGKFYNREDVELLKTLANQGAVAIENARMAEQMKNEEMVRANLARYLSPQIVDQIIRKDVQVNLGGDRKVVTILFSDIRNFTTISETMAPEKLVQFLNEYFTEMARVIFDNQGSLDKYIGDAIVAVFGSLIPLENSAEAAVKASVEMMQEMVVLNEKWKDRYGFNMEMGIGINTGEVFLGNIGSPERMEFTVIGDTVNIASRFSGLAKERQILATRTTRERLGSEIPINHLPSARVKGKAEEVEVFEIFYE